MTLDSALADAGFSCGARISSTGMGLYTVVPTSGCARNDAAAEIQVLAMRKRLAREARGRAVVVAVVAAAVGAVLVLGVSQVGFEPDFSNCTNCF